MRFRRKEVSLCFQVIGARPGRPIMLALVLPLDAVHRASKACASQSPVWSSDPDVRCRLSFRRPLEAE